MDLVLILGDQLTPVMTSLVAVTPESATVLMVEIGEETTYAWHHKQKLVFVLSAMRHFADELRGGGWTVDYVTLTETGNTNDFTGEVRRAVARHKPERLHVTEAAEWRVQQMLERFETETGVKTIIHEDERFIASHAVFEDWAKGRASLTMEFFYREMRRRTGILMGPGGEPEGGRWNFDAENRKPAQRDLLMPRPDPIAPDATTNEVLALVEERFADNPGSTKSFGYAVTRADAERLADAFFNERLARFGDYQDAMLTGERVLYHAVLSPYLNVGLLDPLDLCRRAEAAWRSGEVDLNCAEGFIRQILGWREFVRGLYWREMPGYRERNALKAMRRLPWFYWDGETEMNCLKQALAQTLEDAYAHHIQRLMITGNFAMLAGVDPFAVHEWYLAIYIDAFEWVELPNTLGMSQFGDGGLMGTKPYAASANYIDKMSDYCGACTYSKSRRHGEGACPFNYLYWDFLDRNRTALRHNRRLMFPYKTLDRFDPEELKAIRKDAAVFLKALDADAERAYAGRPQRSAKSISPSPSAETP